MMWGLGYSLTSLLKLKLKGLEKYIMQLGLGLGTFPILVILLNTFKIPLTWWIFLGLAIIVPIKDVVKLIFFDDENDSDHHEKKESKKTRYSILNRKNIMYALAFVVFLIHLLIYLKGAFIFPYLEDGDPWQHADTSQYIAEQKSYSLEKDNWEVLHYTEPYPPTFAAMNAMLYQMDGDMKWILKFFNSFVISLGLLFAFFLVSSQTGKPARGLFAEFLLAAVPCYASHFIFAASLGITLFFPGIYALIKIQENKRWTYVAGIITASIFVSQPITAGVYAILIGVYWLSGVIVYKDSQYRTIITGALGITLSLIYYVPTLIKFGFYTFAKKLGFQMFIGGNNDSSGGVIYAFKDYLISPIANKIDQATGFGAFIFIGILLSIAFYFLVFKKLLKDKDKERSRIILTSLVMFLLTFLASQSNRWAYKFFPHRIWAYMAIAGVLLLAYGFFSIVRSLPINKEVTYLIIAIFIIGVVFTSAIPKNAIQTASWPPDYWYFPPIQDESGKIYSPELNGYLWMENNIKWGSNTFVPCYQSDQFVAGVNMGSHSADPEINKFRKKMNETNAKKLIKFAKEKDYEYVVLGRNCVQERREVMTVEKLQELLIDISNMTQVEPVYVDQNGMFIFKVN